MVSRIPELEKMRSEMDKLRVSIMNEEILDLVDRHITLLEMRVQNANNKYVLEAANAEVTAMRNLVKRRKKALTTTDTVEGYQTLIRDLKDASENSRTAASNHAICRLIDIIEHFLYA
jgi:hypothetical protein